MQKEIVELISNSPQEKLTPIGELLGLYINDTDLWAVTVRKKQYAVQ